MLHTLLFARLQHVILAVHLTCLMLGLAQQESHVKPSEQQ